MQGLADHLDDPERPRRDLQLDADIRALLAELRQHRERHSLTIPTAHYAVGEAVAALLELYLDDDTIAIPEPQITALEYQAQAAGHYYVQQCGLDPYPELRAHVLDVVHRVGLHTPTTNRFQIAATFSVTGVARDSYAVVVPGIGSRPVSAVTGNEVGTRLREAREAAGLTKYELAKRSGVREEQLRKWERGHPTDPTVSAANLHRMIPHIGGTIDWYLYGVKPK